MLTPQNCSATLRSQLLLTAASVHLRLASQLFSNTGTAAAKTTLRTTMCRYLSVLLCRCIDLKPPFYPLKQRWAGCCSGYSQLWSAHRAEHVIMCTCENSPDLGIVSGNQATHTSRQQASAPTCDVCNTNPHWYSHTRSSTGSPTLLGLVSYYCASLCL